MFWFLCSLVLVVVVVHFEISHETRSKEDPTVTVCCVRWAVDKRQAGRQAGYIMYYCSPYGRYSTVRRSYVASRSRFAHTQSD